MRHGRCQCPGRRKSHDVQPVALWRPGGRPRLQSRAPAGSWVRRDSWSTPSLSGGIRSTRGGCRGPSRAAGSIQAYPTTAMEPARPMVGRATDRPARKAPRACSVPPLAVLRRESWTSSRYAPAAVRGTGQGASDGGRGSVRGGFGASAVKGGLDVQRSSELCIVHPNRAMYGGSQVS